MLPVNEITPALQPRVPFVIVNTAPPTTTPPPTAPTTAPTTTPIATADFAPPTTVPRLTYVEPTAEPPAPHERANEVVEFARAQLGVPYLWGGEGPADGGFDCSGLSLKAWEAVGVSLTHQSQIQWKQTARVAKADLAPGDLVFFGAPIHHLGIYIGDGKMIEAPREGKNVRISSINRRDLVGGGRIRS